MTKRQRRGFRGRVSYAFSRGRGNVSTGQADVADSQVLGDLNLDRDEGPTNVDRPHILSVTGTYTSRTPAACELSGVYQRAPGTPFTLVDSTNDLRPQRPDPERVSAGRHLQGQRGRRHRGGLQGRPQRRARPGLRVVDVRAGYVFRLPGGRTLDAFVDMFNATNEPNFANPINVTANTGNVNSSDRRLTPTFLNLTSLVNGVTRTFQLNMRLGF